MRIALVMLAGLVMLSACGLASVVTPEWVTNRRPLPSCGVEWLTTEGGMDAEARRCLLSAWTEGEDAELVTHLTTVEGEPLTRYLRAHANGTIDVFVDATRDAFGSGRWERLRCDALAPATGDDDELVFTEEGCEALPANDRQG
jgi:hypothetical protein